MLKAAVLTSIASLAKGEERCCVTCFEGQQRYYSVDTKHGQCGETCIHPSFLEAYKIFDPNLTIADGSTGYTSCAELGWLKYTETVTYGVEQIQSTYTLDMYNHDDAASPELLPGLDPEGNKALEVIEGLAKGLFDDDTLSNCIVHVADTVPSVASSLKELGAALKSKNPLKIAQAIKNVRQVLRDIPQELQDCGANLQDVKDLLDRLKELVPSIVGELVSAHESLHLGNWEGVGEHVGKALRLLIPGIRPHSPQDPDPKSASDPVTNPALEVIVGLSYGLFDDQTFSECLANVLQDIPQAETALSDLVKALKSKHLLEIRKAIIEVMQAVKNIPDSLKPCSDNIEDLKDLLTTLKEVGTMLVDDIEHALNSFKDGNFEDFGEYVGKAVRMVVYDRPDATDIVV